MLDGFGEKGVKECWVSVTDKEVESILEMAVP